MATYNGAKYLEEQIDSILRQTLPASEIVVCDDCSTDRTIDILNEYSKKDGRFRVFVNEKNIGFKRNFEKAVSLCQGDYIALSDQDDIWMSNHLELLMNAIDDKILSCGNAQLIDENGANIGITFWEQESFDSIPTTDMEKALSITLYRSPYQGAAMMIKKELLEYALPIPQSATFHDSWFAHMACFCGGIECVNEPILKYRRTDNSVTGKRDSRRSKLWQYRHSIIWSNKADAVRTILERVPNLNNKERSFLLRLERICLRNNTRQGRFLNFVYKTLHYRTIYNATYRKWK